MKALYKEVKKMNDYCFAALATMVTFDIATLLLDATPWYKIKSIFWFTLISGILAYLTFVG